VGRGWSFCHRPDDTEIIVGPHLMTSGAR
jgi:hypothetical protein